MTVKPPDLNTMAFSTKSTTANTIDTPIFAKYAESPPKPNDTKPTTTTAEKNKKGRKSKEMFVNINSSDNNKNESTIIRTIEYGGEIIFIKTKVHHISHIRILPFESHKKVFSAIQMTDRTTKIITKKEKRSKILTPSQKDKNI